MKSHSRIIRRLRALTLGLAACAALAAPAAAEPGADYPQAAPAPKSGDTPADYPGTPDAPGAGKIAEPAATLTGATDTGGFDWASAAIGASGAGVLIVVSLGGMALASGRRMRVAR